MSQLEHQFSIRLDSETFDRLREMGRVARRNHRDQAARLVERALKDWVSQGRPAEAAALEPNEESVAA